MKKLRASSITNPEQKPRRRLRLNREQVSVLSSEALRRVLSGCDTTSGGPESAAASKGC